MTKKNELVRYKTADSDWKLLKVLGRGGKVGGKNNDWLNVEDGNHQFAIDWSVVTDWETVHNSPDNV